MDTKYETVKALIGKKLIDKKAFRSWTAATQQPDQVLVLHTADYVDFIVEICSSMSVVKEKPLYSNLPSISQHTLQVNETGFQNTAVNITQIAD